MCEDPHGCINCGCKPQFVDSESDAYCSEECYMEQWDIKKPEIKQVVVYECGFCHDNIDTCDECNRVLNGHDVICDHENAKHFCSKECLFKQYSWEKLEQEGGNMIKRGDNP